MIVVAASIRGQRGRFKKRELEALKKEGERSLWEWEEWVRDGK